MNTSDILVTGIGTALPGVAGPDGLLPSAGSAGTGVAAPPVDPGALIGRRGLRYKDRASQLALCAAQDGLRAAGLLSGTALSVPAGSTGVVVSSNLGNLDTVCEVVDGIREHGVAGISPMGLPNASSNVVASSIAIRFGLRGPNLMVCNGATSGLDAVHWAAVMIRAGRAERVLVIGVETHNRYVEGLLGRPAGELLDGAVALVVESAAAAAGRGAQGLAVLGGYAREAGVDACLDRILAAPGAAEPGLWFVPEGHRGEGRLPEGEVPRHDLTRTFGSASGALGVLQCAAAAGWLSGTAGEGPGPGTVRSPVLVTSGTDQDDASAGLLLSAVAATP
ncbi:beta-ketoacyl synthase N-terminal-like domain-containing protein [Streptomyces sp. NBC_01408]|uniref:beta-ketoacyl synthase N-terminal-like domain-containing protein n=1 Tax=Streptomyces sp. NBC_01408 TaxID=2903855 RepID=UPI00225B5240|nr:beta-ketoacyl synthase N-terminal-like domain-containing protein [Streptomyces sp. NBC_01408]MCX4693182.1 beta-ketoacyl synthase [Streptomyces sp. NBC_01408]